MFLSATPHNGHSSSFSTLLEILDPYRFTRGVKVRGKKVLEDVMVRRLKEDIRAVQGGFPVRRVERVVIDGLPEDAPELELSRLLDEYRGLREKRHAGSSKRAQASAGLLVVGLQQRLLSSIEAFARSLAVHRKTVARQWSKSGAAQGDGKDTALLDTDAHDFLTAPDADDERALWTGEQLEAAEEAQVAAVTQAAEEESPKDAAAQAIWNQEQVLLDRMEKIAGDHRHLPEAKMRCLIDWVREHMCPGLPEWERSARGQPGNWNNRRVLIFTENREGTKRRLREILESLVEETDQGEHRIAVIDGMTRGDKRKEIQRRFNADPDVDPLRILIATDAAREGLNFQAHCADLFHFDLPWNPGRLEQRNGRIDRKLQPADEVRCHYFALPQRVEDRVLEVLVRKTETIKKELGSLSKVIDDDIERRLKGGIRHADADELAEGIGSADLDEKRKQVTEEELEVARDRQADLNAQIEQCQNLLQKSRTWVGFESEAFRDALSCSLELIKAPPLKRREDHDGNEVWEFPPLNRAVEADPSWAATLDTLRAPRKPKQKLTEWRREAPIRPVIFEDAGVLSDDKVHLHLEQRVAQRLLSRFRSQGFIFHDLQRACLAQSVDSVARVVLLGRLSLYGAGAERLHEEIVPVAARWIEPQRRSGPLKAYAREAEANTLELLESSLSGKNSDLIDKKIHQRLLDAAAGDIEDLLPQLAPRAEELADAAVARLAERGEREASSLRDILERQRTRVEEELARYKKEGRQLTLDFNQEEQRQLDANAKSWAMRLQQFDKDLAEEPDRIRAFYDVRARRVEPVGLVYLWPETN